MISAISIFLALLSSYSWADTSKFQASVYEKTPLKQNIRFWIDVYTKYSDSEGLVHDAKYVDHVYEVLDLRKFRNRGMAIKAAKEKWKRILLSLHQKQGNLSHLTREEKRVYLMFKGIDDPNKFLDAAHRKRLRFQIGQKEAYFRAWVESGKYIEKMEKIFSDLDLPVELTRLPFVESSFNFLARSKVGASGIWQLMPSTGLRYLNINPAIDERNDPLLATRAAAKLLKANFDSLQSWPLAVTAYNHGRKNVDRIRARLNSNSLETFLQEAHSRSFGFASSNFFVQLIAAIEIDKNAETYFGTVHKAPALRFSEWVLPAATSLHQCAIQRQVKEAVLKDLNPALSEAVLSGNADIPAGYPLRLP